MNKEILVIIMSLSFLIISSDVRADLEVPQEPYVVSSPNFGRYYFKMQPDTNHLFDRDKGKGEAYQVLAGDRDSLLWITNGWYAGWVFLSSDGIHLVRLGNWPRGNAPSDSHLAVAFYKNGNLLKSYSTKELIRDLSRVQPSISHYEYLGPYPSSIKFYDNQDLFRLVTVDDVEYIFDIHSGDVVEMATKSKFSTFFKNLLKSKPPD
jgi:hypothetical protein